MTIAAHIEHVYRDTRCAVFVPEQFVEADLGSMSDVLRALKELEDEGDLRGYTTVRCADGHDFLGGPIREVLERPFLRCNIEGCWTRRLGDEEAKDEDYQPRFITRYAMSRRWKSNLDQEAEKKKIEPPAMHPE